MAIILTVVLTVYHF